MLLNTIRDIQFGHHLDRPATQNEVLEMVNDPVWDAATADDGPGVDLDHFGILLKEMFVAYKLQGITVEVIHVDDKSEKTRQQIHRNLLDIENGDGAVTLLALNFDDRCFINANVDVGHISPVGAYDLLTRLVLVFDVDREWTGPYWITEEMLLNGLNTVNKDVKGTTPTYRGYVRICTPTSTSKMILLWSAALSSYISKSVM